MEENKYISLAFGRLKHLKISGKQNGIINFDLRVPSNLAAIVSRKVFWGARRPFLATILTQSSRILWPSPLPLQLK